MNPIYQAQGILTLISRAWNLVRLTLKNSVITMLAPSLLLTGFYIVVSIPASQTFLTPTPYHQLVLSAGTFLVGLGLGIVAFFFWGFSCCALIRLYYSAIVLELPCSLKECWTFVNRIKWPLALLLAAFIVLLIGFILADFMLLFVGMLTSIGLFGLLASLMVSAHNPLMTITLVMVLLLWGFMVLSLLITLVTLEGFFFVFPIISLATANDPKTPWWRHLLAGYRLLFSNLPRLLLFALALFGFSLVVSFAMNGPVLVWAWWEMTRLGVEQQHHIPFHVHAVLNLWRSVVDLLMIPFYISAVTLFWYDCRVRKEALDLRLWFNQIISRRGKTPGEFLPEEFPSQSYRAV